MIRPLRQTMDINGNTYTVIGRTVQDIPKYDLLDTKRNAYVNIPSAVVDLAIEKNDDEHLKPYLKNTAT